VFVFIRGGGFMNGGGAIEPDNLMDRGDVVLVTLNYRLGPFGELASFS
jgi:para-nitrobenzyl esterase